MFIEHHLCNTVAHAWLFLPTLGYIILVIDSYFVVKEVLVTKAIERKEFDVLPSPFASASLELHLSVSCVSLTVAIGFHSIKEVQLYFIK